MSTPTSLSLPANITVVREPGNPGVSLLIDGVPFPYFIAEEVVTRFEDTPQVRVTLVARSVTVVDRLLENVALDHQHDTEEEAPAAEPALEPTAVFVPEPELAALVVPDQVPAEVASTTVGCNGDCACGRGDDGAAGVPALVPA